MSEKEKLAFLTMLGKTAPLNTYGFVSCWEADIPPSTLIPKGTVVRFNHVWGHTAEGITPAADIVLMVKEECELGKALADIEKIAIFKLQEQKSQLRDYFIEGINFDKEQNTVTFKWGT